MAHVSRARLLPIKFERKPKNKTPTNAPSDCQAPIQLASWMLIGPVANGESFDNRIGNDGDNHPIEWPTPRAKIFTAQKNVLNVNVKITFQD